MSSKDYVNLDILPVGKTTVFYSPIEGEDDLVRTGTLTEGSCFFHSVLHAYSRDYISMDRKGRVKFAERLQRSMAGKLKPSELKSLDAVLVDVQEHIHQYMKDFYEFINSGDKISSNRNIRKITDHVFKSENDREVFTLVVETLSIKDFEKMLEMVGDSENVDNYRKSLLKVSKEYYNNILKEFGDKLSSAIAKSLSFKVQSLITAVCDQAEKIAFKTYNTNLKNPEFIDSATIGRISDKFNRDIYFLNGKDRLPYSTGGNLNIKGRKSNILIWVNNNHYEIVGKLLTGDRIQREFDPDDILIDRVKTFLFEPEKIPTYYPKLSKYISDDTKKTLDIFCQSRLSAGSESDSDSEHYKSLSESDSNTSDSESDSKLKLKRTKSKRRY